MLVFPNAKINLGLRVLHRRDDGFHDIETLFYPLPLYDVLEITRATDAGKDSFVLSGIPVAGDAADNLCLRAHALLKKDFPQLPHLSMHLHKAIPMGAGLGGGSADGSFTLRLLNDQFKLGLDENALLDLALRLGSDCPFFILNQPAIGSGRGEKLEKIKLDMSAYRFVIVNPGIHVHTGQAFSLLTPSGPVRSVGSIIQQPIATWKEQLVNDFEEPVFRQYPVIGDIKEQLYQAGAIYAAMSGSGSTVFGIFEKGRIPALAFPADYEVKQLNG